MGLSWVHVQSESNVHTVSLRRICVSTPDTLSSDPMWYQLRRTGCILYSDLITDTFGLSPIRIQPSSHLKDLFTPILSELVYKKIVWRQSFCWRLSIYYMTTFSPFYYWFHSSHAEWMQHWPRVWKQYYHSALHWKRNNLQHLSTLKIYKRNFGLHTEYSSERKIIITHQRIDETFKKIPLYKITLFISFILQQFIVIKRETQTSRTVFITLCSIKSIH